jgi:hypothetical protein
MFFVLLGCSKDNNMANPSIKLESYDAVVPPSGNFNAQFTYSQNNGNLTGDSLFIIYFRYNNTPIPSGEEKANPFPTSMPATPNTNKADFTVTIPWATLSYGINNENDTIDLSFVMVDAQGRHSDTVKTSKVIVVYQ